VSAVRPDLPAIELADALEQLEGLSDDEVMQLLSAD
jgi:hypothetical protein